MFEKMFTNLDRKKIIIGAVILLIIVIFIFYLMPALFHGKSSDNALSEFVINEENLELKTGEFYQVIPDFYPSTVVEADIEWTSSNTTIATVDESGIIHALRPGTAIISANTDNGLTDYVLVHVIVGSAEVKQLSLNMEDISLKIGTHKKFAIQLNPSDIKYQSLTWETSNNKVVTISEDGEVYGLAVGSAVITARVKVDNSTTLSISSNVTVVKETTLFANQKSNLKNMYKYSEQDVSVQISDSSIQIAKLEVYSSNNDIATLTNKAVVENNEVIKFRVQALSQGSTSIEVKVVTKEGENLSLSIPVEVKNFNSISTDVSSVTLYEAERTIINAKVSPSTQGKLPISCVSNDTSIIAVSASDPNKDDYNNACLVVGLKKGKATMTITMEGKTKNITVYVNTKTIAATGISLSKTSATLPVGQTLTLTATVRPTNATNKTVTWTSSNSSIATVSNGIIVAKKAGKTTITAKNSNGNTATCTITVNEIQDKPVDKNIPVTRIALNPQKANVSANDSIVIKSTIVPVDATDRTIVWTSSDTSLATVNNGVVTTKNISTPTATVVITATAANGITATSTLTIIRDSVSATGITLSPSAPFNIKVRETKTITATITPTNTTDKTVTWTSSDPQTVMVINGVVTGKKVGKATITAQNSSGQTAKVDVNVIEEPQNSQNPTVGDAGASSNNSANSSSSSSGGSSSSTPAKPTISITKASGTAGENGWYVSDIQFRVNVTAPAGLKNIKYCWQVNGKTCNPIIQIDNGALVPLRQASTDYKLYVQAVDNNGNTVTKASSAYKIDKTKPTCSIIPSGSSESLKLTVKASDTGSSVLGLHDSKSSSYTNTTTLTRTIKTGGSYTFYVKDKAGNTNTCSRSFYTCYQTRICRKCTSGDCLKGCSEWANYGGWTSSDKYANMPRTKTFYGQTRTGAFDNADCSNG